jgi:hypothetical protein
MVIVRGRGRQLEACHLKNSGKHEVPELLSLVAIGQTPL